MKSTFISRENNEVKFTLEFTAEEFEKAVDSAYTKEKGKYALDGFRKGKAPRKLIEASYGDKVFYEEAINTLFHSNYQNAIEELDLFPIANPFLDLDYDSIEKDKDIVMNFTVTVKPIVEVKDYVGVKVKHIESGISNEDINKEMDALQTRNSRLVVVERPAKDGDTVLIDYAGFLGEEQFEGGTAEGHPLVLGSGSFIPGFEEQLIGATAGSDVDVNVSFPEEYHAENLAGKAVVFKVKVHEIKESEKPELNDDFAKDISEFDTLDELKEDTKKSLEETAKTKAVIETKNNILEELYSTTEIDIPNVMVDSQISDMMNDFDQQLRYQGMNIGQYLSYLNKDIEDFREELREDAHKKTKTTLIVEAVADAEDIQVSEAEIDQELEKIAAQYKIELENLKKSLQEENIMQITHDIKIRKAVDFLYDNAIFE